MKVSHFRALLEELHDISSWKTTEKRVREEITNTPDWKPLVSLLAGQEFDNNGIAPTSACKGLHTAFPNQYSVDELERLHKESGTVTDALLSIEDELPAPENPDADLRDVYSALQRVASKSGDDAITSLGQAFRMYDPVVVSYGALDDYSIGVKESTVKNAVGRPEFEKEELDRVRGLVHSAVEFVERWMSNTLPDAPTPGVPFKPMAAKSRDVPETDEWVGQFKIDGYRLLVHVSDGEVTAFTRNLNDETHSIPELDEISWPDGEYIFDCEAIAYDGGEPLGFKATSKRIGRKHNILTDDTQIHFKMFDILYANEDLSRLPFEERFGSLEEVAPSDHQYVDVIPLYTDISACLDQAESEDYEGIIAKNKTAPYRFGKRSNDWRKVKVTEETIDLRIAGFEREYSADGETLGSIELETQDGVPVGRLGTGFSDAQKAEIWVNQDEYYGTVIEVQFEGFDEKLRFPSFQAFRPDGEADSLERIENIIG